MMFGSGTGVFLHPRLKCPGNGPAGGGNRDESRGLRKRKSFSGRSWPSFRSP